MIGKLFLIIGLVVNTAIAQHIECAGAPDAYFVTHPASCSHYFACVGGIAIADSCPSGYFFNPIDQLCDHPHLVDCITCALFGIQTISHPTSCSTYYQCSFGERDELTCPPGTHFDLTAGQCNDAAVANCDREPATTPTLPTLPTLPTDGSTSEQPDTSPTSNQTSDAPITTPVQPDTTTPPASTVNPPNVDCSSGQLFLVHESDCSKYYICVDGRAVEMSCASGLLWNQLINSCDFPHQVTCKFNN